MVLNASVVGNGVCSATFLRSQVGLPQVPFPWVDTQLELWMQLAFGRALTGFVILAVVRSAGKLLMTAIMKSLVAPSKVPYNERYSFVVPVKFVTYILLGFSAAFVIPLLLSLELFQIPQ